MQVGGRTEAKVMKSVVGTQMLGINFGHNQRSFNNFSQMPGISGRKSQDRSQIDDT